MFPNVGKELYGVMPSGKHWKLEDDAACLQKKKDAAADLAKLETVTKGINGDYKRLR